MKYCLKHLPLDDNNNNNNFIIILPPLYYYDLSEFPDTSQESRLSAVEFAINFFSSFSTRVHPECSICLS